MSAAGALLGLAAGDVLGAGYEGMPGELVREREGAVVRRPVPGSVYTDDTQQATVLAYHLLRTGGVVPEELAADLASLAEPVLRLGVYRGAGPGFAAFVRALAAGAAVGEAAQRSAGNGAAMRIAPVAVRFHGRRDRIVEQSLAAASVTHADPRGISAAVAVAVAIDAAASGTEGPELVRQAADAATEAEHRLFESRAGELGPTEHWHTFSEALRHAARLVGGDPVSVAREIGLRAAATSATGESSGTSPYAPASVVTAIVLAAPAGDAAAAVGGAVALGGDADTVGAMVGAVAGARGDVTEWPWEVPNAQLFLDLGGRLAAGVGGLDGLPDLYRLEAALG